MTTIIADEIEPTPMAEWAKDHWTTLSYVECMVVDAKGVLDNNHVRCNPWRHRMLLGRHFMGSAVPGWNPKYSTRLRSGRVIVGHDDWDCLNDMVEAGLCTVRVSRDPGRRASTYDVFGGNCVRVKLTPLGHSIAGALRAWRADGKPSAEFQPSAT